MITYTYGAVPRSRQSNSDLLNMAQVKPSVCVPLLNHRMHACMHAFIQTDSLLLNVCLSIPT